MSHSLALVEELCDRVLYLDHGRTKALGEPREMLAAYRLDVAAEEGERLAPSTREKRRLAAASRREDGEEQGTKRRFS